MSCFICKRKKKPAPEPARAPPPAAPPTRVPPKAAPEAARAAPVPAREPPKAAAEAARAPPRAVPVPAREPPKAAPEPRPPPPPRREEVGPSNGRNQWVDGHMEMPTYNNTYWNNYSWDDAHSFVDKFFNEDPNPRMPKPIPRSQFQQDYDFPETLMSSAETYYDYGCVGAPSFDPHPNHYPYGSGY